LGTPLPFLLLNLLALNSWVKRFVDRTDGSVLLPDFQFDVVVVDGAAVVVVVRIAEHEEVGNPGVCLIHRADRYRGAPMKKRVLVAGGVVLELLGGGDLGERALAGEYLLVLWVVV